MPRYARACCGGAAGASAQRQQRRELVDGYVSIGGRSPSQRQATRPSCGRAVRRAAGGRGPKSGSRSGGGRPGRRSRRSQAELDGGSRSRTVRDAVARPRGVGRAAGREFRSARGAGDRRLGRLDEVQPTDVDQPARRVAVSARRPRRGAPAGHARAHALVRQRARRSKACGCRSSARALRRARRGQLAVQPAGRARRRCTPRRPARRFRWRSRSTARAGAHAGLVAGRRPLERDHGARRLVGVGLARLRGFGVVPIDRRSASRPAWPDRLPLFETYPRFTMIGGDVEAVRGDWAIRGEAAAIGDRASRAVGASDRGRGGVSGGKRSKRAGASSGRRAPIASAWPY